MSVPAWDYGLPPGAIRLKARVLRERERAEALKLSGALNELLENQAALRRMVDGRDAERLN